jgi:hypothetical protein
VFEVDIGMLVAQVEDEEAEGVIVAPPLGRGCPAPC